MKPTDPTLGLTALEVVERTLHGLVNRTKRSDARDYLDIAARNFLTLFNALVVPAAVALVALGDYRAGLAVCGMALANTLLGLLQELRAKRHLDRLSLLAEARVRVRRNGQVMEVASGDVVQGEVVLLSAGDPVVADGPVLESRFLEVDEALLTGESDPVPRQAGDRVLSGSFAVAGEGAYLAEQIGAAAFAQRTAAEARSYSYTASPLQRHIDRLIRILTALAVALCVGYLVLYQARRNFSEDDLLRMIAATITSMVPQGLVLMATLAFLLGAVRMAARGALVNRLSAVEAMASIDTLCMDKTGTLTTNRLRLAEVVPLGGGTDDDARRALRLFASNSLDRASSKALQAAAAALGEEKAELLDQLPFKSQNRASAVRLRSPDGERSLVLGAAEALRPLLADASWEAAWRERVAGGLRILLLCDVAESPREKFGAAGLDGYRLRPLALVALSDELRPEAAAVLGHLAGQNITFKILSGDNPQTVQATVAPLAHVSPEPALRRLGEGGVVTGAELEEAAAPDELIADRHVFGRVSPWQKVQIVRSLRAAGRQVVMVGDGVNDVLPIKNATLGVAMGDGSSASKTVAGVVLQTNDFGLLPDLLDEGRVIVRNLRRAGKLFLTKNAYMLVLIVGALAVFNLPFPLAPQQVTLLNFLTIGLPALMITFDRDRAAAASRPDFVVEVGGFALRTGLVMGVVGLALVVYAADAWPGDVRLMRTLLLTLLVLLGSLTLWRALIDGEPDSAGRLWPRDSALSWLPFGSVGVYAACVYVAPVAEFFELETLTAGQWGLALAAAAVAAPMLWAGDWWASSSGRAGGVSPRRGGSTSG